MTPAVCRASAGAVEHLPVAVVTNLARYLEEIKGGDLWVVGAAGESGTSMWQADLSGGLAFVFGAEGKGLAAARPPDVRPRRSRSRSLGQVESLNVSVAAAVLLYEARRQRNAACERHPGRAIESVDGGRTQEALYSEIDLELSWSEAELP